MISVREAIERTILLSLGAASLTRDRAEAIVDDFVRRGQLGGDEGRAIVDKVMARVRGEGAGGQGLIERLEGGVQGALREVGVASRQDLDEIGVRLDEIEHRIRLLEAVPLAPPAPAQTPSPEAGPRPAPASRVDHPTPTPPAPESRSTTSAPQPTVDPTE